MFALARNPLFCILSATSVVVWQQSDVSVARNWREGAFMARILDFWSRRGVRKLQHSRNLASRWFPTAGSYRNARFLPWIGRLKNRWHLWRMRERGAKPRAASRDSLYHRVTLHLYPDKKPSKPDKGTGHSSGFCARPTCLLPGRSRCRVRGVAFAASPIARQAPRSLLLRVWQEFRLSVASNS